MKPETQKLAFLRTDMKFWTYHVRQMVKKEIGAKIYCHLLYKAEILALKLSSFMVVEYATRSHQKKAIFEVFSGKFCVRNGHNIWG
jgi:hypothetical protein